MARRVRFKQNFNIKRVVKKVAVTVIALWIGGTILNEIGSVMLNTQSPFYEGLTLIGWTVNASNHITATSGSGILAVVGIVGVASIVLEFVEFNF